MWVLDWGHYCCVAVHGAVSVCVSSGIPVRSGPSLPGAIGESAARCTGNIAAVAVAAHVKAVLGHVLHAQQHVGRHVSDAQKHVLKA